MQKIQISVLVGRQTCNRITVCLRVASILLIIDENIGLSQVSYVVSHIVKDVDVDSEMDVGG